MKGLREVRPELASLWVRFVPRSWPGPETASVDLAGRVLRSGQRAREADLDIEVAGLDDLLYLPAIAAGHEAARDRLIRIARREGVPVLVQRTLSQVCSSPSDESEDGVEWVVDPLASLLDGRLQDLERLPAGSRLLLPLIQGFTGTSEEWLPILDALCASAAVAVYPLPIELDGRQRRWLGERTTSEVAYRALYHGPRPDCRPFARAAADRGLETLAGRPTVAGNERERTTRLAVAELDLIAELWLAIGRSPATAQSFFRAARKLEEGSFDLVGLRRDGNLRVLEWLVGEPGEVVEKVLAGTESRLLGELRCEYLGLTG